MIIGIQKSTHQAIIDYLTNLSTQKGNSLWEINWL